MYVEEMLFVLGVVIVTMVYIRCGEETIYRDVY